MTSAVVDSGGSGLEFDSSGVQIQSQVETLHNLFLCIVCKF